MYFVVDRLDFSCNTCHFVKRKWIQNPSNSRSSEVYILQKNIRGIKRIVD